MKNRRIQFTIATFVILLFCSLACGQTPQPAAPATETLLTVGGQVDHPLKLLEADLAKMLRSTVRAKAPDGKEAAFEGVSLVEILKAAGVKFGEQLRGKSLANYLLVEAADGYRVVFALPELDPAFNDRIIILADRRDGDPLSAKQGPLQIIVPGEKLHARWVRQVISLTIRRAE